MPTVNTGLPRAVVFDLDGTLVDSVPDLCRALNWLLAREARHELARDEVVQMVGDGVPMLVERAFAATGQVPEADRLADRIQVFTEHYEANAVDLTQPYPGVENALRALTEAGCSLGICTNKPAGATAEVLEKLDLAGFFDAVTGGDSLPGIRKPDARHLVHVLDGLGVGPADAVMVGDNHNDVGVAKNAGVPVIAVTFGYAHGPVADLGADRMIDHFGELIPALSTLAG